MLIGNWTKFSLKYWLLCCVSLILTGITWMGRRVHVRNSCTSGQAFASWWSHQQGFRVCGFESQLRSWPQLPANADPEWQRFGETAGDGSSWLGLILPPGRPGLNFRLQAPLGHSPWCYRSELSDFQNQSMQFSENGSIWRSLKNSGDIISFRLLACLVGLSLRFAITSQLSVSS